MNPFLHTDLLEKNKRNLLFPKALMLNFFVHSRRELLVANFQVFLGNHPNSGIIFMHAWSSTTIMLRPLIMRAMAEWYGKGLQEGDTEHARLSRVLDVAQELKALSMLLQSNYFPFVIDLAVLASRREYLNLDKWLADQMQVRRIFKRCVLKEARSLEGLLFRMYILSLSFQQQMALASRSFQFLTNNTVIGLSEVSFYPSFFLP